MTKTRKLISASVATVLLMSVVLSIVAYAQPTRPMTVYGTVIVGTTPAPAGLTVYAKDGTTVIDQDSTDAAGMYALSLTGPADGTSIDLYVGTENVVSITLDYSGPPLVQNLTIAAVATTGNLSITTTPVNGAVSVNGSLWGTAPQSQLVAVGTYNVSFGDMTGYTTPEDEEAIVTLDTTTDVTGTYVWIPVVSAENGTLSIVTTPVSGVVSVNGTSWGTDPVPRVVDIGSYAVSFGAVTGYTTPVDQVAVVTKDTTTNVTGTYTVSPVAPTNDFSIDNVDLVHVGYVDYADKLTVGGSGVTAGTTVNIFWDYASGTYALLLNTTEGKPDGTFECEFKVPSDYEGDHYLWATDESTGETVTYGPIEMKPKLKLSPSSGLIGDDITIKGYGFTDEANFTSITFDGVELMTTPADIETDKKGYFTYTFEVPKDIDYDTVATEADISFLVLVT